MKNFAGLLLVAVILGLGLTGCSGGGSSAAPPSPTPSLTGVSIEAASNSVAVGQQQQLTAIASYSDASTQDVTSSASWQSTDPTIASVSASGMLQALKAGPVSITATVGGKSGSLPLTVAAPTLLSIQVVPSFISVAAGQTYQMKAKGGFSDGTSQDVTSEVSWSSNNLSAATVNGLSGLASAVATGQATITATSGAVSGTATIAVTSATLVSIVITPAQSSIATGQTQQFTAYGLFSDSSTTDITKSVVWDTDAHSVATMSVAGLASGLSVGTAHVSATSGAVVGSCPLSVTAAVLQSIDISPDTPTIPVGGQVQFTVTGTFSDSTTQDLTNATYASSDPSTATIDPVTGVATGVAANSTPITITATVGSLMDTSTLTVTPAVVQIINVAPATATIAEGTMQQFGASGIYSDGSIQPLVQGVGWSSSVAAVAGVDSTGMAWSTGVGQANINAAYAGITGSAALTVTAPVLQSLAVTPAMPTEGMGGTEQFTATGGFSDGSTQDVTPQVQWTSSDATVALINSAGLANALSTGTAQITAQLDGVSGSTTFTVSPVKLTAITVTPANPMVPTNDTIQFSAIGVYNNGTTAPLPGVFWYTSRGRVARINWHGLARTKNAGTVTVYARLNGLTGSTVMTVTSSTLASVQISPVTPTIAPGTTEQFTLIGSYGDGTRVDLTRAAYWQTSNPREAYITEGGLAYGSAPGQVTITASYKSMSNTTTLTVSNASITGVSVNPPSATIASFSLKSFTATGSFSDGSSQDITPLCRWTSSDPDVAIAFGDGLTFSFQEGLANINATFQGQTGSAALTVQ